VFNFALSGNSIHSFLKLLFIKQVIVVDGLHFGIELEYKGYSSRNVVAKDLFVVHSSEFFNNSANRVTVGNNYGVLSIHDLRADGIIPVRHDTIKSSSERFGTRKGIWRKKFVALIMHGMSLITQFKLWGRDIVTTSPLEYFLFSMFLCSFDFVKSLEGTIVAFVKSPGFMVRYIKLTHFTSNVVVGLNGTLKDRSIGNIEVIALFLKYLSSSNSLLITSRGKINIVPTSESVLKVPYGLTVSKEDYSVSSFTSFLHD